MYDFQCRKDFDAGLSFTDTDTLTYELKSEDVYEELFKHKYLFDFCSYSVDSIFFDQANKRLLVK